MKRDSLSTFLPLGSVTIYNHTLSEMTDLETVSKLTGVCPQSNVQFDFLTVKENLRLFAKIKGIQSHEVEQEVEEHVRCVTCRCLTAMNV